MHKSCVFLNFVYPDPRSFECSSPSELDRAFDEWNQLPMVSLDQLSISRMSSDPVNRSSDGRLPSLTSLCQVSDLSSPSHSGLNVNSFVIPVGLHLPPVVFLDGKVSTPEGSSQQQKSQHSAVLACFEHSLMEVSASQLQWDLSLIKADAGGGQAYMESTTLESTLSPQLHPAAPLAMVEIPSPIWKDASPKRA